MEGETWIKLDKKLFNFTRSIILFGVNRSKHKKHKYQIFKYLLYGKIIIFFSWFFMSIIHLISTDAPYVIMFIIPSLFILILLGIGYKILRTEEIIKVYTPVFKVRKNPEIYKYVKQLCKRCFDSKINFRKIVLLSPVFFFAFGTFELTNFILTGDMFVLFTSLFFLYVSFCRLLENYLHCVFDFDKPKRRIKKKAGELTDRQKQSWLDLISLPKLNPNLN